MRNLKSTPFGRLITSLFLGLLLIGGLVLALVGTVSPVLAATCTVTPGTGTYPSIQAAIDDMNCDPISVPAGTHTENLTIGRSLTLNGAGKTSTIIDGSGTDRVVTIDGSGIVVYINDLRLTNGDASGASPNPNNGGGILATGGATLRGENLQIDNNIASTGVSGFGGGLAANNGSAYLTSTTVYSNVANQRAGVLTGNGQGGGLYVNIGTLQLADSSVSSNVAAYRAGSGNFASGGGLHVNANTQVYLSGNTWQGNVARGSNSEPCDGGTCASGLDHEGGGAIGSSFPTGTADITISKDIFMGNIANNVSSPGADNASRGGAIALNTSNTAGQIAANFSDITMTQNIAVIESSGTDPDDEGRGGALYARHTDITVERANIYNNQAAASGNGSGGGFYTREPLVDNSVQIINSILAGNLAPGGGEGAQVYVNHVSSPNNNVTNIVYSTLADDTLNPKEALFYHSTNASDMLAITNTIVASHAVGIQNVNVTGRGTARYMLFFGNTDNHPSPGTVAFPDMTGWVAGDPNPLFVDPPNNNYHIRFNSPAIDAAIDEGITDDIDGDLRPNPDSSGFDIGADEFTPYKAYVPVILKNAP